MKDSGGEEERYRTVTWRFILSDLIDCFFFPLFSIFKAIIIIDFFFWQFVALYDYDPFKSSPNPNPESELRFKEGDILRVFNTSRKDGFYVGKVCVRRICFFFWLCFHSIGRVWFDWEEGVGAYVHFKLLCRVLSFQGIHNQEMECLYMTSQLTC